MSARTLLRTAAPLAAVFLLTGAFLSCEGTVGGSTGGGGSGGGGSGGERPNSAAMGRWTPNTAFDTCTQAFHDTFFVIGPDGKKYPTWHPPTATDPTTGRVCTFGHEHGRDPRGSALFDAIRTHFAFDANGNGTIDPAERDASGVPFGYAAEQLRGFNAANGIGNGNRDQPHTSFKITWENGVVRTRTVNGVVQTFDLACDALTLINQDTFSADAYASNLHEVIYAVDCNRGNDAARFGGRVIASAMATFGDPGGFVTTGPNDTFVPVRAGTPVPGNSPTGRGERGRVIPTADNVLESILVRANAVSDFSGGLVETWTPGLALLRTDGTVLASADPAFAVFSPSRYYDAAQLRAVARSIDLCYIGYNAAGVLIDDPLRAGEIVRQARGPECAFVAPLGPATPRALRIPFDDPRSIFNGCRRTVTLGQTRIANANGITVWYTDPFGRGARSTSFPGATKQLVAAVANTTAGDVDRVTIGATLDPCPAGSGVHN
jgi:hypothetical protein